MSSIEEQFLEKLKSSYDELLSDLPTIIDLPRHQKFSSFNPDQLNYLQQLIDHAGTLDVKVFLLDSDQNSIELDHNQDTPFKVEAHLDWEIDLLQYHFAFGIIWISLHFQDELEKICQSECPPESISKEKIIFASVFASVFFMMSYFLNDSAIIFKVTFVLGLLCLYYIFNHIRTQRKTHSAEAKNLNQLHISQYFSFYLGEYVTQQLKLDPFADIDDTSQ